MKRFWGKLEGFSGVLDFVPRRAILFGMKKSRFFVFSTNATKATNATPVFERRKGAFIYIIVE